MRNATVEEGKVQKIRDTRLGLPLQSILDALHQEVVAAQNVPGRAFAVKDGKCLFSREDSHLYEFRAELQLPIPVETPIRLLPEVGDAASGTLVAVRDLM
jgi:hypothetical protein